jgi:hypothetical protein
VIKRIRRTEQHETKELLQSTGKNQANEKKPNKHWEKILANSISDRGLISKIHKNSYNSIAKK